MPVLMFYTIFFLSPPSHFIPHPATPLSVLHQPINPAPVRKNIMQLSQAEKQNFVNALDQAKRTVHPDLVIMIRRYNI